MNDYVKVAFVCVHNSCRSQMAEAVAKILASDVIDAYSAGTELVNDINKDAVALVKKRYGVDMSLTQTSKLIDDLPPVDVVITMGCNVSCPTLPSRHREDWGLDDPSGKEEKYFIDVLDQIEAKVKNLRMRIINDEM